MSDGRIKNRNSTSGSAPVPAEILGLPAHLQKYWKYVENFDISDNGKVELIHTVVGVVGAFVDRAFGEHPVQICLAERETNRSRAAIGTLDSPVEDGTSQTGGRDRTSRNGRSE